MSEQTMARPSAGHSPLNWQQLREQMPVARRWAYFDHAAVAPLSGPARDAMTAWADDLAANGDAHWPMWAARLEHVRPSRARRS